MATIETVQKLLTLARVYPNQPADDETRKIVAAEWLRILRDVPDAVVCVAYDEWAHSAERFAPVPGWLCQRALELTNSSVDERAEAGWQQIIDSFIGYDVNDTIAIDAVRRAGGLSEYGQLENEREKTFFKKRFVEAYRTLAQRNKAQLMLAGGAAGALIGETAARLRMPEGRK